MVMSDETRTRNHAPWCVGGHSGSCPRPEDTDPMTAPRETRSDGFWDAEAREVALDAWLKMVRRADGTVARDEDVVSEILAALQPFVERMIEDERARAGQIMDRALADVQKASEDVQADLDAAASLARQAASDRARDCAAAEDVIRRRGIELGRLDAAGRKLAEAVDAAMVALGPGDDEDSDSPGNVAWAILRAAVAASPWGDER